MTLYTVFFNSYGRLRSGWRFLIFLLLFIFFSAVFGWAAQTVLTMLPIGFGPDGLMSLLVNGGISLFLALGIGSICGKFLEGLPFRAVGAAFTKYWFKNLCLGLAIGAVSLAVVIAVAVIVGGLRFHLNSDYGFSAILVTLGVSFVVFAVAAAFEEALFRGYILQTFSRAGLAWLAIILTSLIFALVHLSNPGANWISSLNTAIAGVWFGVAYLKTRDLWLPFGIHFMWNWVQGSIFGIEVSGLKDILRATLLQEVDTGPAWLTGANYGIEASLTCTIVLIISTAAIYFAPLIKASEEMVELTGREQPINTEMPSKS
jgi:membrane protease YdiL (CAAX protease family)